LIRGTGTVCITTGVPVDASVNALTWKIIRCAMAVHSALGPGLLESAYLACLIAELRSAGVQVDVGVKVPLTYRGLTLDCGYRLDLLVENTVILELKTVSALLPIHEAQLVTYLKLTGKPIGLLLNFNVTAMKDGGIKRKINT
jgi:GxxExxY protein